MKSESIKELASALAKVKFGEIGKNKSVKVALKSGGSYNFQYAPLEVIMSAIRRPLAEQGLSLTQSVERYEGQWIVTTTLLHESGEWVINSSPVIVPQKFNAEGKPIDATAQEFGSAVSYARRYGVTLIGCLVADEDDDANIADGNEVTQEKFESPGKINEVNLALEGLPPEVVKALRVEAKKIEGDFLTISAKAAHGSWTAFEKVSSEAEVDACWKLIDTKVKTGIRKFIELKPRYPNALGDAGGEIL